MQVKASADAGVIVSRWPTAELGSPADVRRPRDLQSESGRIYPATPAFGRGHQSSGLTEAEAARTFNRTSPSPGVGFGLHEQPQMFGAEETSGRRGRAPQISSQKTIGSSATWSGNAIRDTVGSYRGRTRAVKELAR